MINVTVDDSRINLRLNAMSENVKSALKQKITDLADELRSYVITNKLSGQVLNAISHNLQRSIFYDVQESGNTIYGRVASDGSVKYAGIHEFGGTTPPHDIYPVNGKALHFAMGGEDIFAKVVHHPGSVMPERSYLRSSLRDKSDYLVSEMRQAVMGASK